MQEFPLKEADYSDTGEFLERHRPRLEEVRKSVQDRLGNVCSHLPEDEFQMLVEKIAREQVITEYR